MKRYFSVYLLIFLCFVPFLILSLNEKKMSYVDNLYQLIKTNSISGEVDFKNIKVKNKNFEFFFIKINEQDQNSSNSIKLTISKKFFEKHKVINVVNDFNIYKHSLLIISSSKYFNSLKFVFSNREMNHQELTNIFEDKHNFFKKFNEDRDETKYLLKKRQILNCKVLNDPKAKFKYCEKIHHMKVKNYELPDIIFQKYKYFYFKIDNDYVKFSNA